MDTSSSSKVTVEYHDPNGLFPLISDEIASRIPLKNLVWRSPTRPQRQIESLHLDFVPDSFTSSSLKPPASDTDSNGTTSLDIVRSGIDPRRTARRHQIPGLQTSPYLKLYILRADDKDAYKTTERQRIRDWIKDNAAATSKKAKGRSENHDAFEWVIIHVVIPDTIASSEPRWRESSKDPEELKERKTGMKLPGKSTRTVFDVLRADFNESGKSGQDRVAQIRLTRAQLTPEFLIAAALATTIEETNEEREKTWNDLMIKFKSMILAMFDARVRQYEADVAEQDSRRAMPGFNYCTFFIYKEGLAMAFESVGLVEDALVIYDELSLGYETVLKTMASGASTGSATILAPFTVDIIDRIVGARHSIVNGASDDSRANPGNMHAFQKDYRERIVRSEISPFDFSCYLFARQNALILRLANARASGSGKRSSRDEGHEDLVLISEVCWRAANFIHNAARSLRQDLCAYRSHQWEKQLDSPLSEADVESLVSSWTYIVAGQMLHETYSPALEHVHDREMMQNGGLKHRAVASLGGVHAYPQRTTSLPARGSRTSELQGRDSLQSTSDSDLMSPPMSPRGDGNKSFGIAHGLLELVTYRAELVMMQRKMLEQIAKQRQWVAGWALMEERTETVMTDVDLDGWAEPRSSAAAAEQPVGRSELLAGILAPYLVSKEEFRKQYEVLSNTAMRLFATATQSKRAESIMGDLAILNYQQSNYEYAASYFQHVLPFYAEEGWSLMEIEALRMHAMCLKELDRKEEYVVTLLALVAKACGWRKAQQGTSIRTPTFDEVADVSGVLPEALAFSQNLDVDVSNPAEMYFAEINLGREVMHHEDRDGFFLRLQIRHTLDDEIMFDQVSAKLVHLEDANVEVWLAADNVILKRGMNTVLLESTTTAFGTFSLDSITIQSNKVIFTHETEVQAEPEGVDPATDGRSGAAPQSKQKSLMFLYPKQHAFVAELSLAQHVQINKTRYLDVRLDAGQNDIEAITLKLRPATAGLRLHLADAVCDNINRAKIGQGQTGQLALDSLSAGSAATVKVPYTLEQPGLEIMVRVEASYTTTQGSFTFLSSNKLQTRLPLDVDVNDLFQADLLFSNFTVRATRHAPVLITNVEYTPSALHNVESPPALAMPMPVFENQPVKLLYKITRTEAPSASSKALMLDLQYYPVQDLVIGRIKQLLSTAIETTSFVTFTRLLQSYLQQRIQRLLLPIAIDMALLMQEATIPSFAELGWSEIIAHLPQDQRAAVRDWLLDWHQTNTQVPLDADTIEAEHQCSISIPVEGPSVDFVHDISLDLQQEHSQYPQDPSILSLGQPIRAGLTINSSTAWAAKSKPEEQDFTFDIQAEPDTWLIGGQVRSHFRAKDHSRHAFEILLIPLQVGYVSLPQVYIQPALVAGSVEGEEAPKAANPVSCESHHASAGRIFRVVRASQTTRVYVPEAPGGGRPVSRPGTAT